MAGTFYYPPTAPAPAPPATGAPGPILLTAPGPAPQRRATVAVRLILAIPHLVVLYFLALVVEVLVVIGWFGALVTGRLPEFAETFLAGYLRWYTRVGGYLLLLTDQYPPFAFEDDPAYPVRVAVGSGRLSRLTVLFRLILAIPAFIVLYLATYGLGTIVIFIGWLIALVAGRLPASLHQAIAAVLRYFVRCNGYMLLLTGDYPGQLFGDQANPQAQAAPTAHGAPGAGTPGYGAQGYGTPGYGTTGYGTPGYGTPGYGDPRYGDPSYGDPRYAAPGYQPAWPSAPVPPVPGSQDPGWRLVLSPGARRLLGLVLVLGLLTVAGEGALVGSSIAGAQHRTAQINQLTADVTRFSGVVAAHNTAAARARQASLQIGKASDSLSSAYSGLTATLNSPDFASCSTVSCFNTTSVPVAGAFTAFGHSLQALAVPPGSAAAKKQLIADTAVTGQDWRASTEDTDFTSLINDDNAAEKDGNQFDKDYTTLWSSLSQDGLALDSTTSKLNQEARTLNDEGAALLHRAAALNVTASVPAAQLAV